MFSFRTTPLSEQGDKALSQGSVGVIEDATSFDVASGRSTSGLFEARGNLGFKASSFDFALSLEGLSAVVLDVTDAGSRNYGPFHGAFALIEALQALGDDSPSLYVVDHSNPAGRVVEGSMPSVHCPSGCAHVALRHGLTIGELCYLHYTDVGARFPLHIISYEASGNNRLLLPFSIPLCDGVGGMFTAQMYPGASLWKHTNVSPFIEPSRPYEFFGAPFLRLNDDFVPCPEGVVLRPCEVDGAFGYQIILLPGAQYHSLLHTIQLMRHFSERCSSFEFLPSLWSSLADPVIEAYLKGEIDFDIVEESVKAEEQKWIRKAKRFALYEESPVRIK